MRKVWFRWENWLDRNVNQRFRRGVRRYLRFSEEQGDVVKRDVKVDGWLACPNCTKVYKRDDLHLPKDTIHVKIRCEKCNTMFQVKMVDGEEVVWQT